jgi:hypothetical protein
MLVKFPPSLDQVITRRVDGAALSTWPSLIKAMRNHKFTPKKVVIEGSFGLSSDQGAALNTVGLERGIDIVIERWVHDLNVEEVCFLLSFPSPLLQLPTN